MPIATHQLQAAAANQHAAAHDPAQHVRLVAGPGTGKSYAIEERVCWLIRNGTRPRNIYAVSFTRASSLDLRKRIHGYCVSSGLASATQVQVSTLHSLALRTLRAAGMLEAYPANPLVLDDWEIENIFDAEFRQNHGIGKTRAEEIRHAYEALWSTGTWGPPNYVAPTPPITQSERDQFEWFHGPRTQCYSCVLPGEIVRKCVDNTKSGVLDTVQLLQIRHLVVDEFQDLNPMDLEFINAISSQGASVFVAGDDDQSIYSFRFASPAGIQAFDTKYPQCGSHTLTSCFRCTPAVLSASDALISGFPPVNRIAKTHVSLYKFANPPLAGIVHRWKFPSGMKESKAVAESCLSLINAGLTPSDILILISNTGALLPLVAEALESANIPFEPPRAEGYLDSKGGRLVLALTRIACNTADYVAHRTVLGLIHGVGVQTQTGIADQTILNNVNYRSIFYDRPPSGVFKGRLLTAAQKARSMCSRILGWQETDSIDERLDDIAALIESALGVSESQAWRAFAAVLPPRMMLRELMEYLWADTSEQQNLLLDSVYDRLGIPIPTTDVAPLRVRVMTMHGAKGLSAKVVFIPGLEEDILPGAKRQQSAGLVLEAARLLYVSITRARAACFVSFAQTRVVHGQFRSQIAPSRFVTKLDGPFFQRRSGLDVAETQAIMKQISLL